MIAGFTPLYENSKNHIILFILRLNSFSFVLLSYFIFFLIVVIPFEIIKSYFDIHLGNIPSLKDMNTLTIFFAVVFIAPLIETLIFQIGVIKLVYYILPKYPIIPIIVSATLFGLTHFYSIYYVIYTVMIGLFLGTLYFISKRKKISPFWVIFSVHALYNLTVFVIKEFSIG